MKLSKGDYLANLFVIRAIEEKTARDFALFKEAISCLGQRVTKGFISRISGILYKLREQVKTDENADQQFMDIEKFIEISKTSKSESKAESVK